MQLLTGKTAIVTGAASGIGLGIACAFAREGMNVAPADIEAGALERARRDVEALGAKAIAIVTDVSDRASMLRAAEAVERALGKLHVAVNNAGVSMHNQALAAIAPRDWDWLIGVNLMGEGLHNELKGTKIGVSVLCPAADDTLIYRSARNRPKRFGGPTERQNELFLKDLLAAGWPPDRIGARVVDAIRASELFVFAHPPTREWVEQRHARLMAAFDRAAAWEKAHPA